MNKVILRFYSLKDKTFFEVVFDKRLSFYENFKILKEIFNYPSFTYIFDKETNVSLCLNEPLKTFCFNNFMTLYLI